MNTKAEITNDVTATAKLSALIPRTIAVTTTAPKSKIIPAILKDIKSVAYRKKGPAGRNIRVFRDPSLRSDLRSNLSVAKSFTERTKAKKTINRTYSPNDHEEIAPVLARTKSPISENPINVGSRIRARYRLTLNSIRFLNIITIFS